MRLTSSILKITLQPTPTEGGDTLLYFDQTASTQPLEAVLDCYVNLSRTCYANPSALHRQGFLAEQTIRQAARDLAQGLGCLPEELIFTSGATESINLALQGALQAHPNIGQHLVTWAAEHKATLETFNHLESLGYQTHYLPTNAQGLPDEAAIEAVLHHPVGLISFSLVNNETGAILPLERLMALKQRYAPQALVHIDAVQGYTKLPFKPKRLGVDLASFSGHKIGAPKGIGLLYCRKGLTLKPLFYGGGQQRGIRSGTENPILARCMALAAELQLKKASQRNQKVTQLKAELLKRLADSGLNWVLNSPEQASPYVVNLSFPGIRPETLVHALAGEDIYVATHAACSGAASRSHVLDSMLISEAVKTSAIRLSLDETHESQDLERLVDALKRHVPVLQQPTDHTRSQRA